jgi:hypothetical protein
VSPITPWQVRFSSKQIVDLAKLGERDPHRLAVTEAISTLSLTEKPEVLNYLKFTISAWEADSGDGKRTLEWKDRGIGSLDGGDHHSHEAPATEGLYAVVATTAFPSMEFGGYRVAHMPFGTVLDGERVLKTGVATVEEAKAIAQADHDAGNDVGPFERPNRPRSASAQR